MSLFVYGTLMPGQPLWPVLAPHAESWLPATARGRLWDTGLGYPAARFDSGHSVVPGVLVVVAPGRRAELLARLDDVEAEGRLYRRVELETSAGPATGYEWLGPTVALAVLTHGWVPPGR